MYQAQWWKRTSRYLIARYGVFQRYKLFYFVDEQVIDPLGTDQLSEQKFEIYQHKRLERALRYEEHRDDSFDFLQIGEDDIDDFDDLPMRTTNTTLAALPYTERHGTWH